MIEGFAIPEFNCTCGRLIKAPAGTEGRVGRCPACGLKVTIPLPPAVAPVQELKLPTAPRREPLAYASPPARIVSKPLQVSGGTGIGGLRRFLYLVMLLGLIPLGVYTFQPHMDVKEQLQKTVDAHPEVPDLGGQINHLPEEATDQDFFDLLPGHRLMGALLARESMGHWLMALAAAGGFAGLLALLFPTARHHFVGMVVTGLFTGTIGILVLFGFQFAAAATRGVWIRGGGAASLVMLIVKFIGFSYDAANDPDNGFILSFIGFTCGVGLCEEITKQLPLLFRVRRAAGEISPTWHSLMVWGMASGIGFGIAEGILYSGRHYNGIDGLDIYLVRFISCVVLHSIWAGAAGITLYNSQDSLKNAANNWSYCGTVALIVIVPMVLHGLYDTLLKQEHAAAALAVAVASFGWLAYQIEMMRVKEPGSLAMA